MIYMIFPKNLITSNYRMKYSYLLTTSNRQYSVFTEERTASNRYESQRRLLSNKDNHFSRIKPIYSFQNRNISDYVDGNSFYKWLSESVPVEHAQNFIVATHDYTGLPWWGNIICTTIFLRTVITFPLAIYQAYILAKVENIALIKMPEVAVEVRKEISALAMKYKWNETLTQLNYKRLLKQRWDTLIIQDNCHPFKGTITLWIQIPMWVFITTALRNLALSLPYEDAAAHINFLQLSVGGFLWVPNLTVPDETWFLPAILGIANLSIIELQSMRKIRQAPLTQKYVTNFFRCFSIALIPISATVPSAVCLYWATSSVIGLGQNLLLMSNRLRKTFNIPDTPTTVDNPYLQLISDIKERGRSVQYLLKGKKDVN